MAAEKTELEWPYRPADFFEARYCWHTDDYKLVADAGIVLVTLSRPSDPIDAGLQGPDHQKSEGSLFSSTASNTPHIRTWTHARLPAQAEG